jgi:catechol 2,3-dioxygenase-like lactoylglutathione lyase family enzyme
MRLKNILIVVSNIEKSIDFYKNLFGLQVILYNDTNVMMTEGLVLQERSSWQEALGRDCQPRNHTCELYFEERNMEAFVKKLENYSETIEYVNTLMTDNWGQQMIRIYDPDGNLIEVRTPMGVNNK